MAQVRQSSHPLILMSRRPRSELLLGGRLSRRTVQLGQALTDRERNYVTIAIGRPGDASLAFGKAIVVCSSNTRRRRMIAALGPGEMFVSAATPQHAETAMLEVASMLNLNLRCMGFNRPSCRFCRPKLHAAKFVTVIW